MCCPTGDTQKQITQESMRRETTRACRTGRLICLVFALLLGCGSNDRAESPDTIKQAPAAATDPAEIVRAAIEAHGGESVFAKANVGRTIMTIDGALQPGVSGQFTKIDVFDLPGKHKRVVKGQVEGHPLDMNFVLNGDKAWMQMNGGEPTAIPVINPDQGVYPTDNFGVLVAIKGPDFKLSVVPSEDLARRPVHRIRMETADQWVGDLFFDKETHLLVASKKELFDDNIGKTRSVETYYSAHKKVDGLILPMSIEVVAKPP